MLGMCYIVVRKLVLDYGYVEWGGRGNGVYSVIFYIMYCASKVNDMQFV